MDRMQSAGLVTTLALACAAAWAKIPPPPVIALHILLPALTVGLAVYIAVLEGAYFVTHRPTFLRLSKDWIRIFAVSFGMGVVSGIVMPFQFGTNWSGGRLSLKRRGEQEFR